MRRRNRPAPVAIAPPRASLPAAALLCTVAALLVGACSATEGGDSPADGSRFGNARPASARASTAAPSPAPSTPAPTPAPALASTPADGPAVTSSTTTTAAPRTLAETSAAAPQPATAPDAAADAADPRANVLRSIGAPPPAPAAPKSSRSIGGWNMAPNTQYHIQTDEGPERYFKYQTISGQYRKEKRLSDGTVVGTYGWVDPNGYLRLRDYVADSTGYRVLKTKMVFVGKDEPIGNAVSKAKYAPSQGGSAYVPPGNTNPPTTPAPPLYAAPTYVPPTQSYNPLLYSPSVTAPPSNSISNNYNGYNYNYSPNQYNPYQGGRFDLSTFGQRLPQPPADPSPYDGISATHNGFRYFLPRHYHEEETLPGQQTAGSFGYVDPFGIRRVIYYNASPGSGFVHRKNNRYVGFNSTPYDPRF